jgi:pimeloyl-ACP methyl ester carboxylesterase
MPAIQVGDVELFYELRRDGDEPVLLLVMGLGGQLTSWDEGFCDELVRAGFGVLRFDNRDTGLSTSFESHGTPDLAGLLTGDTKVPYDLADLAADAVGLLDALGIAEAHVAGISLGGMIVQTMAISYPQRLASLCSIMSATGAPGSLNPTEEALAVLLAPPAKSRQEYIDSEVVVWRVIGSPGFPFDEEAVRRKAAAHYDRSFRPDGIPRQLAAALASPDRTAALGSVRVPTLVVHGDDDPLIPVAGGVATADAIPGARLLRIPGMGHDLPPAVWPEIASAMADNAGIGARR